MNICSRCGTDNNYNAKFCRGCGVVLEGNQGAATITHKKHNALLIGLGISVGIVVPIVIGLLFFLPPHNPLVGKWHELDKGDYGDVVTFFADGSYESALNKNSNNSEEYEKLSYETHGNEIMYYYNGEFLSGMQYSIEGSTLTLKTNGYNIKYEKIE